MTKTKVQKYQTGHAHMAKHLRLQMQHHAQVIHLRNGNWQMVRL